MASSLPPPITSSFLPSPLTHKSTRRTYQVHTGFGCFTNVSTSFIPVGLALNDVCLLDQLYHLNHPYTVTQAQGSTSVLCSNVKTLLYWLPARNKRTKLYCQYYQITNPQNLFFSEVTVKPQDTGS